jgi:hypothetical protein
VATRKDARVEHDPIEDVVLGHGEHVLDLPHPLAVAAVHLGRLAEAEIGARLAEVGHRASLTEGLLIDFGVSYFPTEESVEPAVRVQRYQ